MLIHKGNEKREPLITRIPDHGCLSITHGRQDGTNAIPGGGHGSSIGTGADIAGFSHFIDSPPDVSSKYIFGEKGVVCIYSVKRELFDNLPSR